MKKEQQWNGYYDGYLKKASRQKVKPQIVLDNEWADGLTTAENCIFPYLSKDSSVLEIACGIGRVSRYVAPKCKELYCTDILEDALDEAKNALKDFKNVQYYKTDGYTLKEFSNDSFDCVYSFTAFFHFDFEIVVNYFAEIKRVLKTGGIAVIEFKKWIGTKDVNILLNKIIKSGGIEEYEASLDKWRYVSEDMMKVLCNYYDLNIINPDVTSFTFTK